ncbi:MAG TPA: hypothetical protein VGR28_11430 [Candidatus Thermoplasmatota archaeon]|nr:hypothetical protein [Candidatus Thermoplasmatota archaeon]
MEQKRVLIALMVLVAPAAASASIAPHADGSLAGVTVLRSVGSGHVVLDLAEDADILSVTFPDRAPGDHATVVLHGPGWFLKVVGPGFEEPPGWAVNGWHLDAGTYHAYVLGPAGAMLTARLELSIPGATDLTVPPAEGSVVGLAQQIPSPGPALPAQGVVSLLHGQASLARPGPLWVAQSFTTLGAGFEAVVERQWAQTGPTEAQCGLGVSSVSGGGNLGGGSIGAFSGTAGSWDVGIDLALLGAGVVTSHQGALVAYPLAEGDTMGPPFSVLQYALGSTAAWSALTPEQWASLNGALCTGAALPAAP